MYTYAKPCVKVTRTASYVLFSIICYNVLKVYCHQYLPFLNQQSETLIATD